MGSETLMLIGAVSGTILGSNALFAFIQFLIQRKDNKNDKIWGLFLIFVSYLIILSCKNKNV